MKDVPPLWKLSVGGNRFLSLVPHDLNYFQTHFVGRPIEGSWVPPPVKLWRKSRRLPDFVSWMKLVPVISERAKVALDPLVRATVQFLPFHALRGKSYFALNVLEVRHGLLDEARSNISRFSGGGVMSVDRAIFRQPLPSHLPPIFKLAESLGEIMVTAEFAQLVVAHQLTGLQFLAPEQDMLRLALGRDLICPFPGTPPVDV